MGVKMAEEKQGKGKETKPGFTTFRVYEEDGENLSDLAGLLNQTAADVYREHCAPIIRKLLQERLKERLKRLGG